MFDMTEADLIEFIKLIRESDHWWLCSTKKLILQKELILIKQVLKKCMLCHYWYFKDVGYKFEPPVCNKCHDVLMIAYKLKKKNKEKTQH